MHSKKPKHTVSKEAQQQAMRELWGRSDEFLRANKAETEGQRFPHVMTPSGVEIWQIGDALRVSAQAAKRVGGRACNTITRVEFSADIRELPEVYEDWYVDGESGTSTIPIRDFKKTADELLRLFEPSEQAS